MSETPEKKSTESRPEQAQTPPPPPQQGYASFGEAVDAGRKAAEEKAKQAIPKLKGAFEGALHDVAYGGAFGVCFAAYFARELVPEEIRNSVSSGVERGRNAAKAAVTELRSEKPGAEPSPIIVEA